MTSWRTTHLGEVATLQRGFDLPSRLRRRGTIPIVSSSGTSGWHDQPMVKAPGVVTGRYGTIGEVFFEEADFWPLNTTLWVSNFHGNDKRFVYYLLQMVNFAAHSGKSGVPGVNRNDLHRELVSLPLSVDEQREIAGALSDCDDLIAVLERQIAKKKAIKQGVMQHLMIGQNAFAGLTSEIDTVLGEITTWLSGGTPDRNNPTYWGGAIPWISAATLKRSRVHDSDQYLTEAGVRAGSKIAPPGATLILVRGMALHRETRIGVATRPVSFNQDVKALIPKSSVLPEYLMYALQAQSAKVLDLVSSAGSGTGVLDTQLLKRLPIRVPDEVSQREIVTTIEVVDRDVEVSERLLAKKRAVKRGLMQQLLTGRTRLPVKEGAV